MAKLHAHLDSKPYAVIFHCAMIKVDTKMDISSSYCTVTAASYDKLAYHGCQHSYHNDTITVISLHHQQSAYGGLMIQVITMVEFTYYCCQHDPNN